MPLSLILANTQSYIVLDFFYLNFGRNKKNDESKRKSKLNSWKNNANCSSSSEKKKPLDERSERNNSCRCNNSYGHQSPYSLECTQRYISLGHKTSSIFLPHWMSISIHSSLLHCTLHA
jgi:DNA modification methylase